MRSRRYKIVLTPGEDGQFVVECPSIPGCISQGKTKKEAIENIKEAISLALECYEQDHRPLPTDRTEIKNVAIAI